jgi:ribosomal protein S18 acetylase RimI-like enzyme
VALDFRIETASWHDLNVLRQMEKVCFGRDAWSIWDLIATLTFQNIIHLKATLEESMIGFVAGEIKTSEGVGWITTLGVMPAYRRQGVAKSLLSACEEQMALPRIRLSVARTNLAAIQLYSRLGYHQVGVWPHYYLTGDDALVLEKEG